MASALIIGGALIIFGYLAFDEFIHVARPALRRRGVRLWPKFGQLGWKVCVPLPIALTLAFLMQEARLISIYVIVMGVLANLYLIRRSRGESRAYLEAEFTELVEAFRTIYRIRPSIFSALEEARGKVAEPLRGYVTAAVETFYVTSSPKRAFAELKQRLDNPYLNQFLYILERSETARREAVLEALNDLIKRLHRHEELRREIETNLTVVTGQTQLILIIGIVILFVVALIHGLRAAYTGSMGGQLLFIIVATVGAFTSYYIDQKVIALKERIL